MKTISNVEAQFISQFKTMVQAFEINHNIKFQTVNLIANADGTIGYDIQLVQADGEPDPETTS